MREWVSPEGLRQDGRRAKELRRVVATLGVLPHADGSARLEMGNTKVLAAVFGPRVPSGRGGGSATAVDVRCEVAAASFATATGRGGRRPRRDRRAAEAAALLKDTLDQTVLLSLYPRARIDVCVQILQADGGTLAAAVNAAALALAHAGVPVRALVAAVGVTRLDETCLLDPSHAEVSGDGPEVVVACQAAAPGAPGAGALVSLQADGAATVDEVADMVALGQEGCVAVVGVLRAALLEAAGVDAAARGPAA